MRIIIPIRGPGIDAIENEYQKFLNDVTLFNDNVNLIHLLDNVTNSQNICSIKFNIIKSSKFSNNENEEVKSFENKYPHFRTENIYEYLALDLILKTEYAEKITISFSVQLIIQKFALLVNLSYSSRIDFLDGLIFSDNKDYLGGTKNIVSNLDFAYEHSFFVKWPKIENISLQTTVDWFIKNGLHTDGVSKNKPQRAINAFSYLFSNLDENDYSNLFWVLLGIEALLVDGSNNIKNQLKIKTLLIFGELTEYKEKLNKLYSCRSRFAHGDFDFPAKFSSDLETFEDEYLDHLAFATSILLALIRFLINNGKNEFKFEYKFI